LTTWGNEHYVITIIVNNDPPVRDTQKKKLDQKKLKTPTLSYLNQKATSNGQKQRRKRRRRGREKCQLRFKQCGE